MVQEYTGLDPAQDSDTEAVELLTNRNLTMTSNEYFKRMGFAELFVYIYHDGYVVLI